MAQQLEPELNQLIGKCECAIQRGDTSHLEILHTLQQRLIAAHDARQSSQTAAELHDALEFYHQQIPASERTTTFAALTEQFNHIVTDLETTASA